MEITKKYVATILAGVPKQNFVDYFYEVFKGENGNYNYSLHSVDLLLNGGFKNIKDFDVNEIIPHLKDCIYNYDSNTITDVKIDDVNNINEYLNCSCVERDDTDRISFVVSFNVYKSYVEENKAARIAASVDAVKPAE